MHKEFPWGRDREREGIWPIIWLQKAGNHHSAQCESTEYRGFFFFIFKKIKISKIYVRFGKFQKYTTVALWGATGLKCNFFFFKFATKSLEKKKEGACRPPNGRQAPVAHPSGDQPVGLAYRRQGGRSPLLRATGGHVAPPPRATGSGRLYKASRSFPPLI